MKKYLLLVILLTMSLNTYSQITLKGCFAALSNQDFTLIETGTVDDSGIIRNTFESSPADFTQSCNSGVCEVRLIWNITNSRWEIQLDNDGPLTTPDYTTGILYYNSEASYPNPPDLSLGTWVDNLGGTCGGNGSIATLTGDVQSSTTLSTETLSLENAISFYPNPTSDILTIKNNSNHTLNSVTISDTRGRVVKNVENLKNSFKYTIDLRNLNKGVYLLSISGEKGLISKKIVLN